VAKPSPDLSQPQSGATMSSERSISVVGEGLEEPPSLLVVNVTDDGQVGGLLHRNGCL